MDYAMIVAGTFLIGFAIKNIYDPVSMVTGGVSGVAIIAKELWSVPLWLTNTVLNIPLFAAGFFFCGWRFIKRTLFATVMLSVSLYVLPEALRQFSDYRMLVYAIVLILVMLATNNDTFKAVLGRLKFWGKKKKEVV